VTDPSARIEARRNAADRLIDAFSSDRSSWSRHDGGRSRHIFSQGSLINRFTRPTLGEAILALMDKEQAESAKDGGRREWERLQAHYLRMLTDLRDTRVGPELARRAVAANLRDRLRFARAANELGVSGPWVAVLREITTGTVDLPPPTETDEEERTESPVA